MTFPYKLIDLTHTIYTRIPTWDGNCGFDSYIHLDYDDCEGDTKFRVMKIQMNAGIGTHIDAPSHCIPGAASIHELDLQDLCMPCVVIDVTHKAHELYSVIVDDILHFESDHGKIPQGACVMIKSGWEKFWKEPKKYRNDLIFPSVSPEAAGFLLERDTQALGIDTLSADRPNDGFKVHLAFLGNKKILLENVANLDKMPPAGGFVMACPLKAQNATEAPVRLIGLVSFNV